MATPSWYEPLRWRPHPPDLLQERQVQTAPGVNQLVPAQNVVRGVPEVFQLLLLSGHLHHEHSRCARIAHVAGPLGGGSHGDWEGNATLLGWDVPSRDGSGRDHAVQVMHDDTDAAKTGGV